MKTIKVFTICLFSWTIGLSQNFTEVATSLNVNVVYNELQFGGGVSFADFNRDGWDDLTFASVEGEPIHFFANNQGTYVPVNFNISNTEETKQVLWVDFDNDGDKDFFCTVLNGYNRLYQNNGGTFEDISFAAGIVGESDADSFGACFGDYNNDGWLDLYVANRHFSAGAPTNHLYTNNGNGTFTEVNSTVVNNGIKATFAPVFFDANGSGWQDIFLAQDRFVYRNDLLINYNSNFANAGKSAGIFHAIDAMNAGVADYDNDLDLDIYVTNTQGGNLLLQNNGTGMFTDVAQSAGVVANHIGWAGNFLDAENDGDLDLYVSCQIDNAAEPNRFYMNSGNGNFTANAMGGLLNDTLASYSNAIGDINNDGNMDIAVVNGTGQNQLWRNDNNNNKNWLKIDLVGSISNRDGVGSWVEIYAGNNTYLRYKHCGQAYLTQNSDYLHVGLGNETHIQEVRVKWLSGNVTSLYDVNSNQRIQMFELDTPLSLDIVDFSLTSIEDNAFNFTWELDGDLNDHQVILQKSITGLDFEDVLLINNEKAFRDWQVQQNLQYYYRLKIVDTTGKIQYSDIINASLKTSSSLLTASIFPNPSDRYLNLQINAQSAGNMQYTIFNNSGSAIFSFDFNVEIGLNDFQIDIESLLPNHYFLQIELNREMVLLPFSKI